MTRLATLLIIGSLAYCIGAGVTIKQAIDSINVSMDATIETLERSNQMLRDMTEGMED